MSISSEASSTIIGWLFGDDGRVVSQYEIKPGQSIPQLVDLAKESPGTIKNEIISIADDSSESISDIDNCSECSDSPSVDSFDDWCITVKKFWRKRYVCA